MVLASDTTTTVDTGNGSRQRVLGFMRRPPFESGEATDGRSDRPLLMPDSQQTVKITTFQEEVELPYHVTLVAIPAYEAVRARVSEEQHKQQGAGDHEP